MIGKIVKIIDNNYIYPTYYEFVEENFPQYAHLYITNKFPKLYDKLIVLDSAKNEIDETIYLLKSTDEFVFLIDREGFEAVALKDCLKPGLVVELRNGEKYFVDCQMELIPLEKNNKFVSLLKYDINLHDMFQKDFDIMKIHNGKNYSFWEREMDWYNIKVGEEVWVRDNVTDKWTERLFINAIPRCRDTVFQVANKDTREIEHWNYCKLKK